MLATQTHSQKGIFKELSMLELNNYQEETFKLWDKC
jgi:hypothetical protein